MHVFDSVLLFIEAWCSEAAYVHGPDVCGKLLISTTFVLCERGGGESFYFSCDHYHPFVQLSAAQYLIVIYVRNVSGCVKPIEAFMLMTGRGIKIGAFSQNPFGHLTVGEAPV